MIDHQISTPQNCWIVTEDGLTGTENQCIGMAEALGLVPVVKPIGLRWPWRTLSPWLGLAGPWAFTGDNIAPPWPDLLLASGRKSIAVSRYIRKASDYQTFTAQVQDPRVAARHFDLVIVPEHDRLRGPNVVVTQAAPNRISHERLLQARLDFAPLLEALPAPRVAILIGGDSKTHRLTDDRVDRLAQDLKTLAGDYGLMVTMSRRTGADKAARLSRALAGTGAFIWDGAGSNPYYGFLAWADYIIVTEDSVSMVSEAATTGKPVYVVPLTGHSAKFSRFYKMLQDRGVIKPFTGRVTAYTYPPLADAALAAAAIKTAFTAHRRDDTIGSST